MKTRTRAACHRSVQQDGFSEYLPTYRLDEYVSEARERMGPRKWQQLNAEWELPNGE